MLLLSISICRLQDWVGEASDPAQDRGFHFEEERVGKWAGSTEDQDGLAGKGKEAEAAGITDHVWSMRELM